STGCDQREGRTSSGKWITSMRNGYSLYPLCVLCFLCVLCAWSSRNLQDQAIISQLHAVRQLRARLGVRQIVTDVREVRALRAHPADGVDRFGDAEVRGVRTLSQRVDDHRVDAAIGAEQRPRLVGNLIA